MTVALTQSAIDKLSRPISLKTTIDRTNTEVERHSPFIFATTAIATVAMLASTLSYAQSTPLQASAVIKDPPIINVTELIPRPVLPIEFVKNIRYIFDHDLLLRDDFFDENNLKETFNLSEAAITKDGRDVWMTSSEFSGPFPRFKALNDVAGTYASADISARKTTNQSTSDLANLSFWMYRGGPSFEQTKAIFGNGLTYINPLPSPHSIQTPTIGEHANQNWTKEYHEGSTSKSLILGFNGNSELSYIRITYLRN
jgi:hypothetical protein